MIEFGAALPRSSNSNSLFGRPSGQLLLGDFSKAAPNSNSLIGDLRSEIWSKSDEGGRLST